MVVCNAITVQTRAALGDGGGRQAAAGRAVPRQPADRPLQPLRQGREYPRVGTS